MENSDPWIFFDKCTIQIKIHGGVERNFIYVRYVPDLNKNLISLDTQQSLGYRYIDAGGGLKISVGALVSMKARTYDMLYILLGFTIKPVATILL